MQNVILTVLIFFFNIQVVTKLLTVNDGAKADSVTATWKYTVQLTIVTVVLLLPWIGHGLVGTGFKLEVARTIFLSSLPFCDYFYACL